MLPIKNTIDESSKFMILKILVTIKRIRILPFIIVALSTLHVSGQNAYVKLDDDSTIVGYVRTYIDQRDGRQGFEVWRTKRDKDPRRIPRSKVVEYAIKKDTFKILRHFRPFQDRKTYFETVDAKLISSGKVNLYFIEEYEYYPESAGHWHGNMPNVVALSSPLYVLEDKKTNYVKALPTDKPKLKRVLMEFFPE